MALSDRIRDSIDDWAVAWKDRIRGWLEDVAEKTTDKVLDHFEPAIRENVTPSMDRIKGIDGLPPDIRQMLDNATGGPGAIQFLLVLPWIVGMLMSIAMGIVTPITKIGSYIVDRWVVSARPDPDTVSRMLFRKIITEDTAKEILRDQGWSEERINNIIEVSHFYPSPQDLVLWQAREVFEPNMIAKYGLDSELGGVDREPFYKAGMTDEQITNYWRAHWQHPEFRTIVEMLRRVAGFTEDDMSDWFRLIEIPPFWREKLIDISWEVPTRVDVRRWWDMQTIDEARMREIYGHLGYHDKDLDDYVVWTKVYTAFPDLVARWQKGWISVEEVKAELIAYGMPEERAEQLIQTKIKKVSPERTVKERDLTKTDIYKGVKKDVISRAQGIDLLVDLGYDRGESEYIMAINVPIGETEPEKKLKDISKTDIKSALVNQLTTPEQAIEQLVKIRYSPEDARFLVSIYQALIPPEVTEPQRELTKADIGRALKKGILSPLETKNMLLELGYTADEVELLIELNMPEPEAIKAEEPKRVPKSDIKAALKVGFIDSDTAISKLKNLDYTTDDSVWLVNLYLTVFDLQETTKPRELTKADITKGVKSGILTSEEGYTLLLELGYNPEDAAYLLAIMPETTGRSPISFQEFKRQTQQWRASQGIAAKVPSRAVVEAEQTVRRLELRIAEMRMRARDEDEIAPVMGELANAQYLYRQLLQSME